MNVEDLLVLLPRENRRAGTILGLAVGDALGATYEFCSPREVPEGPLEMVGGGWLGLDPGETTDDTALARAILAGYDDSSLDLRRVRDAMLSWRATNPRDIGNQTRKALDYLRTHPEALSLPEDPDAQGIADGEAEDRPGAPVLSRWERLRVFEVHGLPLSRSRRVSSKRRTKPS